MIPKWRAYVSRTYRKPSRYTRKRSALVSPPFLQRLQVHRGRGDTNPAAKGGDRPRSTQSGRSALPKAVVPHPNCSDAGQTFGHTSEVRRGHPWISLINQLKLSYALPLRLRTGDRWAMTASRMRAFFRSLSRKQSGRRCCQSRNLSDCHRESNRDSKSLAAESCIGFYDLRPGRRWAALRYFGRECMPICRLHL